MHRYSTVEEETLYGFATLLDPRLKDSVFIVQENMVKIKYLLMEEAKSTISTVLISDSIIPSADCAEVCIFY